MKEYKDLKVGDRVKIIKNNTPTEYFNQFIGKIYKISRISSNTVMLQISIGNKEETCWDEGEIVYVENSLKSILE